jgi:hypothetical protein
MGCAFLIFMISLKIAVAGGISSSTENLEESHF